MAEENQPVVVGRDVVKTFKDFWGRDKVKALKGVDIEIPRGTVFGLLGPNGAGKSTLIKLILGHLYPSSGKIAVFGKDPRDVNIKFQIGYLPERSYLYKNLTAQETLNYFGEILNLSKEQINSRTDQLLEMVGLQHSKKRYVGEFSHGMTRRMGLAQALLNDPDFIILDEPTAGLDPVGCREVKDLIITLGKRGKTILLTSHLLADVEDTCDDVMMIFGGKVQSQGHLNQLLADTDRTKLEFPAVDQETLVKVKEILSSKCNSEVLVSSPKQSLESYFLSVVNEGNKSQETAGARQGSGVADYLKGSGASEVKKEPEPEPVKAVDEKKEDPVEPVSKEEPVEAKVVTPEPEPVKVVDEKKEVPVEPVSKEEPVEVEPPEVAEAPAQAEKSVEPKPESDIKEPDPVEEDVPLETKNEANTSGSIMDTLKASNEDDIEPDDDEPEDNEEDEDVDEDLLKSLNL